MNSAFQKRDRNLVFRPSPDHIAKSSGCRTLLGFVLNPPRPAWYFVSLSVVDALIATIFSKVTRGLLENLCIELCDRSRTVITTGGIVKRIQNLRFQMKIGAPSYQLRGRFRGASIGLAGLTLG